jgi:hypothetical protein
MGYDIRQLDEVVAAGSPLERSCVTDVRRFCVSDALRSNARWSTELAWVTRPDLGGQRMAWEGVYHHDPVTGLPCKISE